MTMSETIGHIGLITLSSSGMMPCHVNVMPHGLSNSGLLGGYMAATDWLYDANKRDEVSDTGSLVL